MFHFFDSYTTPLKWFAESLHPDIHEQSGSVGVKGVRKPRRAFTFGKVGWKSPGQTNPGVVALTPSDAIKENRPEDHRRTFDQSRSKTLPPVPVPDQGGSETEGAPKGPGFRSTVSRLWSKLKVFKVQ